MGLVHYKVRAIELSFFFVSLLQLKGQVVDCKIVSTGNFGVVILPYVRACYSLRLDQSKDNEID